MRLGRSFSLLLGAGLLLTASCTSSDTANATETPIQAGGFIEPPFEVKDDCEGLLLVWYDDEGAHTAATRDEIPEAHRDRVRVDSLSLSPEERLDPDHVFVADLRREVDGAYPVQQLAREALEAELAPSGAVEVASSEVIIYGADWCGACRSAAAYFRQEGVEFVERNIEQEPGARTEMQRKLRQAGLTSNGIPVIDFRGTILTGFDRARLSQLIQAG